jgi:uncharacterized protein
VTNQNQILLGATLASSTELANNTETTKNISILSNMANRHGLIAGATGTGKTVTLRVLAEGFSRIGVPVFVADVKGDLAGLSQAGQDNPKIFERVTSLGLKDFSFRAFPCLFWDILGKSGHPLRATVSEMGPLLLSRLFELNDIQSAILSIAFQYADDEGMLLLDEKDLDALVSWIGDHASELQTKYGNIAKSSVGAVQRAMLLLKREGGAEFFGEPALKLDHIQQKDFSGNGVISILDASTIINTPRVYTAFLLWLLSELFEQLPEVGDLEKPKLVFFFDEAHLLFNDAPKALLQKIEQVVRLIRSKGVGVYFVTQNPLDIPETVLGQLGNRVQHALRAFTPKDQQAVKVAAKTFRENPKLNTEKAITELAVGEALVSVLDDAGMPTPVERVFIVPPTSKLGALSPQEREEIVKRSPICGLYEEVVDRESAYELLQKKGESTAQEPSKAAVGSGISSAMASVGGAFIKSAARAIGSRIGSQIIRGVLGSILGGKAGKR